MSEKEEKASEKILKKLETMEAEIQALKTSNKPPEKEEPKHEHWDAESILLTENSGCPECKTEFQKLQDALRKKNAQASKNLEYECMECGTHFGKKDKKCPECGKTTVRTF